MGRLIAFIVALPVMVPIISFISNIILTVLLTMTYNTLTQEQLIATLKFEKTSNISQLFTVHLKDAEGVSIGVYKLFGDQWRMDAGFIKMKYWANIFSVDSKYTLDRLEGRYKSIDDQNSKQHKSYQLEDHTLIDITSIFIDTTYGSSVYKDIKLNTKYSVYRTPTGLMVREKIIEPLKKEKSLLDKTKSFFGFN